MNTTECPECRAHGVVQHIGHHGTDHECPRCKGAGEVELCASCDEPSDACAHWFGYDSAAEFALARTLDPNLVRAFS